MKGIASRRAFLLAGTITSVALAAGIAPATASAQSSGLVDVKFVISHRSSLLTSLPSYLAEHDSPEGLGLFKKHGVKVDFTEGSGGGSTLRLLSTGDVDIAEGGAPAAYMAARVDPNVELVGGWSNSASVMVWIAPKSAHIKSVQDLSGKKLGYSGAGSASQYLVKNSTELAGLKNVQFVALSGMGDNWTASKAGVVTAGWAMEPFLSNKLLHDDAQVVLAPGEYIKHFYLEGIDVNKKFAQAHPEAVKGVFQALYEAVQFIEKNPEKAADMATKFFPNTPRGVLASGIENYLKIGAWNMKVDPDGYRANVKGMVADGQIKEEFDIGKLLNQTYWPENLRTSFE